jgi:8-oxo-dGTP pyrophosphatase MutT (NUDIX family)
MKILLKIAYTLLRAYWFIFRPITLGVRIMLWQDGKVLLLRHTYQEGWFIPGGGVKRGETLEQAARREAREEVGADLREIQFLGMYSNVAEHKSDHIGLFVSHDFTQQGEGDAEIRQIKFFDPEHLPDDTAGGIRRKIEGYCRGDLPPSGSW